MKEVTPRRVQEAAIAGFKRLRNFREARLLFMRSYCGQYYDKDRGDIGAEPLNLIYNAISAIVPNLVMAEPKHVVKTRYMAYRGYGDLLGMALDYSAKTLALRDTLRRFIVDAIFCIGVLKTGLCESGQLIHFDDTDGIDPGTIFTELVDLDDLTFDPSARTLDKDGCSFIGHRIRVPRIQILDSGMFPNDIIERMSESGANRPDRSELLSRDAINDDDANDLHDYIDLVELWVPQAKALVTLPGDGTTTDEFLRVVDYYGPDSGPYTFLSLSQPVPNNPLPVAPVGVWHDLHTLSNQMAVKIIDQAQRQKDVLGYRRASADDAQEVIDAGDGDAIAMEDPDGVRMYSYGGQQRSNEAHLAQLQYWFNLMSGNTEAMSGTKSNADTATQAQILQANASIRIEDLRDLVYQATAREAEKRAWYLHTDPLIEIPLIYRQQVPAMSQGGMLVQPAHTEEVQVMLTPEARRGDFLDFQFEIQPKSMSRVDPQIRLQRAMEFAVKLLPAAASAAQVCMAMGVPFSFPRFVTRMAQEADIEWLDEVFHDPEFQMQMAETMMRTPGMQGSQGQAAQAPVSPGGMGGPGGLPGIIQNGQPPGVGMVPSPDMMARQTAQEGANEGQANLPIRTPY